MISSMWQLGRLSCVALAITLYTTSAAAQEQTRPDGWKVRFDRAGTPDTALVFVSMPPGYHITTGPPAIIYDPSAIAQGQFHVESEISLFDPKGRFEAFGIFVGGEDLEEDHQSYLYFLIRNDGKFLVKERRGSGTETIVPWSEHSAIVLWDGSSDSAKNVLSVAVGDTLATFSINGEEVASLPRTTVDTDGVVGLRVNHRLNLHMSKLEILQNSN